MSRRVNLFSNRTSSQNLVLSTTGIQLATGSEIDPVLTEPPLAKVQQLIRARFQKLSVLIYRCASDKPPSPRAVATLLLKFPQRPQAQPAYFLVELVL